MLHSKLLVELLCNDMQVHVKQVCKTESIPNTENQHAVQLRGGREYDFRLPINNNVSARLVMRSQCDQTTLLVKGCNTLSVTLVYIKKMIVIIN